MKYIEGRDGLEGRNDNSNNNRAEERNSSCNPPLMCPGVLCDAPIRTRKWGCSALPCVTPVTERASPLGRRRDNSSLVFTHSPGCFLGVRKAKETFPFACSTWKSVASAMRRTHGRSPCVSLELPVQRLWYMLGSISISAILWTLEVRGVQKHFYPVSLRLLLVWREKSQLTCSGAESCWQVPALTLAILALRQIMSALSVPPPMKQDIIHPTNGRNEILADLQVSRLVGTCPSSTLTCTPGDFHLLN